MNKSHLIAGAVFALVLIITTVIATFDKIDKMETRINKLELIQKKNCEMIIKSSQNLMAVCREADKADELNAGQIQAIAETQQKIIQNQIILIKAATK